MDIQLPPLASTIPQLFISNSFTRATKLDTLFLICIIINNGQVCCCRLNNESDLTGSFFLHAQIYVLEADASLKIALSVTLTRVSNPLEKVRLAQPGQAWFDPPGTFEQVTSRTGK